MPKGVIYIHICGYAHTCCKVSIHQAHAVYMRCIYMTYMRYIGWPMTWVTVAIRSIIQYMWCMVSIHEVQRVCMRYRHTAKLVLNIWILYGCYTWDTVGIYEIQLVCIMCMGLNMRYSGHKRVKNISINPPSPSTIIINFNTFFTQIQLFKIHTYFNFNLAGYFKVFHPEKEPPPPPRRLEMLSDFNPQLPHLIWDAIICKT